MNYPCPIKTPAEIIEDIESLFVDMRNWKPPEHVWIGEQYFDALRDNRKYTGHEGLMRIFPTLRGKS